MIEIREYVPADKTAVLDLIDLNIPQYFAPEEFEDFNKYLDEEVELYYVILLEDKIVGCGGINFADNKTTGKISWDMIHPDFQGKSLGTRLLEHRIKLLKSIDGIQRITVRTSQLVYRFYEKRGFILTGIQKDYWAKGFDMYAMIYEG